MPKFLEEKLEKFGRKKNKKGKALNNYIYGTMNAIGAIHGNKITKKGEKMEEKHNSKVSKNKKFTNSFKSY